MHLVPVRLKRPDLKIFVPGSDRFVADGRVVDAEHPYWLGLIAEGSLVEMSDDEVAALAGASAEAAAASVPTAPATSDAEPPATAPSTEPEE